MKRISEACFLLPSASLSSLLISPQFLACNARPFSHRLKLRPAHLRMTDPRAYAAIRAGDNVFLADDLGVTHQAVGDGARMFDEVAVMANDAGHEYLAVGQLHVLPNTPLVIVAGVGRLDRVSARLHFENQIGDIPERHVVLMRPMI